MQQDKEEVLTMGKYLIIVEFKYLRPSCLSKKRVVNI